MVEYNYNLNFKRNFYFLPFSTNMVLADLGAKITQALRKLNQKQTIDEATLNELLTEIASALLASDVNIHYINNLRNAVKTQVSLQMDSEMGGAHLRKIALMTTCRVIRAYFVVEPILQRPVAIAD